MKCWWLQASNGTLCVDLSGNDNSGLVTGHLCFASDVKVSDHVVLLVISVMYFVMQSVPLIRV